MSLDAKLAGFAYTGCGIYLLLDESGRPWAKAWEDEFQTFCGYIDAEGTVVTRYGSSWEWDRNWNEEETDESLLRRHPDRFTFEDALREAARNAAEPLAGRIEAYRGRTVTQDRLAYIEAIPPERRGVLCGTLAPED